MALTDSRADVTGGTPPLLPAASAAALDLGSCSLSALERKHLRAVWEWIGRKDYLQAQFELDKISRAASVHPDVLEATMAVHYGFKHHFKAIEVGRLLINRGKALDRASVWLSLADSLHQLGRTQEAYDQLKQFANHGCRHGLVHYRLAVYACLLGKSSQAKAHFANALNTSDGARLKREALSDEQLRGIWDFLCQP